MSSGQIAILAQIGAISDSITKLSDRGIRSILLLIDEGDAFLHIDWQRKYISNLNKMLGSLKTSLGIDNLQLILASHSPLLATDVPKDFITRLPIENATLSGFASPLYILLNESFGTKTIGEFATNKIETIIDKIPNRILTEKDYYLIIYFFDLNSRIAAFTSTRWPPLKAMINASGMVAATCLRKR